jgi:hypothetical protein
MMPHLFQRQLKIRGYNKLLRAKTLASALNSAMNNLRSILIKGSTRATQRFFTSTASRHQNKKFLVSLIPFLKMHSLFRSFSIKVK